MRTLGELGLLAPLWAQGLLLAPIPWVGGETIQVCGWRGRWPRFSVRSHSRRWCAFSRGLWSAKTSITPTSHNTPTGCCPGTTPSRLWVGQAGSLLVWAWLTALLALLLWRSSHRSASQVGEAALGVVMGYVCFLVAIMVFAADPMEPALSPAQDGAGLSPLLQHPAMLIHPPVVFLGYALWTIPFALAAVALLTDELKLEWVRQARPWALAAWTILAQAFCWGHNGRTRSWAGVVTGAGTRWRTAR